MKNKIVSLLIVFASMAYPLYSNAENEHENETGQSPTLWYYLSSFGTDQVFRFEQDTGEFLGVLNAKVPGPFASFVAPNADFFVAAQTSGEVFRFDGDTGELIDTFIEAGSGGLSNPTAPILTPDGKYMIVGDLDLNGYLRYDGHTGAFIDVFADASTKPVDGPFMPVFSPWPEHNGKILIASGFTNSVQIYDIETADYEGDLVKSGSGGLSVPIGLVYGPDGNLYTSSSETNSVKRYNGRTGEYIDDFVPTGSGGLSGPRALEFGGSNSDLYVVSSDTNNVLRYDRLTGEFLGASVSGEVYGFSAPRGLMFSVRPFTFITATPSIVTAEKYKHRFTPIEIEFFTVKGTIDANTRVELVSIAVNDLESDETEDIKGAEIGEDDRSFLISAHNDSDTDKIYTITYRVSNVGEGAVLSTTTVTVPPTEDTGDSDS